MKKNNHSICPNCHKHINPLIGICICGYESIGAPKLRHLHSHRPKKMSTDEWLAWVKFNFGEEAHKKATNSFYHQK